ncbi:MAG: hypothetical protein RBT63_00595 [Bdellovibrionales bacterium]|nr:hypothetical protein [Bdellovibrionales bacterium]
MSQQNNSTDHNLLKSQTTALKALIHAIEQRFPQKSDDLFFIPLQRPNRVVIENEIARKSKPYTQSGFIGSASLLAKGRVPEKRTLLSQKTRQLLLDQITETLLENTSISVSDYINSCGGAISRRQAQRDLESNPNLKAIGHTRNRRYLPKKTR